MVTSKQYKKINEIFRYKYFPLMVYAMIWGGIHLHLHMDFGDDLFFETALSDNSFGKWVINKYLTYNTRIVTESFLVIILYIGEWLWKIINVIMMTLIVYDISELCYHSTATWKDNWVIVCLVSIYPFYDMGTAGWGATSVNYTWPLALGLYVLLCIQRVLRGEILKKRSTIFCILATIYAANVEQMVCVLFAFITIAMLIYFIKSRKIPFFYVIEIFLVILSLLVILLSPAKSLRYMNEVSWSFPTYEMLSIYEKITIGFTSTMAQFIARTNWIFLLFTLIMCYAVWRNEEKKFVKYISAFPLVIYMIVNFFPSLIKNINNELYDSFYYSAHANMPDFAPITVLNYKNPVAYIPIIISILIIGCTIINLLLIFNIEKCILPILILLAGLCTRLLLSFSPTIYESAGRTYLFMYYAFIILTILIYRDQQIRNKDFGGDLWKGILCYTALPALDIIAKVLTW